jgi:uncharacterized protein (TIGR02996 family)
LSGRRAYVIGKPEAVDRFTSGLQDKNHGEIGRALGYPEEKVFQDRVADPLYYKRLSGALRPVRYNKDQFEANIDAHPEDATNHLVYADWLQEQAENLTGKEREEMEKEARFRRSMGNWMGEHGVPIKPYVRTGIENPIVAEQAEQRPYMIKDQNLSPLPEGVDTLRMAYNHPQYGNTSYYKQDANLGNPIDRLVEEEAPDHVAGYVAQERSYRWPTYRAMESAFRRAFV